MLNVILESIHSVHPISHGTLSSDLMFTRGRKFQKHEVIVQLQSTGQARSLEVRKNFLNHLKSALLKKGFKVQEPKTPDSGSFTVSKSTSSFFVQHGADQVKVFREDSDSHPDALTPKECRSVIAKIRKLTR